MKDIPNCKICKLKCFKCSFSTCLMFKGEERWSIESCKLMASKYYLLEEYFNDHNMKICNYQDVCQSVAMAWM